ncbi:M24 family metallopeptidase [Microbacterium sp. 1P10UB]|uniref:M24 family metallopeptidase n=1 Tax=unclassified Microbacterium TaxID=2609290 RepID=UPI0039A03278
MTSVAGRETSTSADRAVKRRRVLDVLAGAGADAVWLTSSPALSWYLDGSRVHTSLLGPPVAAVRVDAAGDLVRVFANEAERLVAEELPPGVAVEAVDWHAPLVDERHGPAWAEESLAGPLRAARAVLLPGERRRYAALCRDTAEALTAELMRAVPDETERALAGRLSAALVARGADPVVVMVAGASRLHHRHPLPTSATLGTRAMVVVCARRDGLISNATRWVRFGPAATAEADGDAALRAVESDAFRATRHGATLGEVLSEIAAAYPRHGFAPDEWTRHHQGGAAGYAGRDPRASPRGTELVQDGQAFAWNPTAHARKIEDTVLLDGGRVTVLTRDGVWPETDVDGVPRPLELPL